MIQERAARGSSVAGLALFLNCCFFLVGIPAGALNLDYWHTRGNQIVDSQNRPVRITGITWYGFETPDAVVHGLWVKDYKAILTAIHGNGYNVIRIPFSNQMVETNPKPVNISTATAQSTRISKD